MDPYISTCASRDAVMGLPELFQMILLCLDQRTLLTSAQRVSKYWHSTIQNTPAIQQALFFKAFPSSYDGPPVFNPLLAEIFSSWFPSDGTQDDDKLYRRGDAVVERDSFESLLPTKKSHQVIRRRRASWTRMLVRQPPIRTLCHWNVHSGQRPMRAASGISHSVKKKRCRRGLRMGKLYDMAMDPPFTVFWEGKMEKVTANYGRVHGFEEKMRTRLHRIANGADLTVQTCTRSSCIKPRPPNRILVKFGRGIEIPDRE